MAQQSKGKAQAVSQQQVTAVLAIATYFGWAHVMAVPGFGTLREAASLDIWIGGNFFCAVLLAATALLKAKNPGRSHRLRWLAPAAACGVVAVGIAEFPPGIFPAETAQRVLLSIGALAAGASQFLYLLATVAALSRCAGQTNRILTIGAGFVASFFIDIFVSALPSLLFPLWAALLAAAPALILLRLGHPGHSAVDGKNAPGEPLKQPLPFWAGFGLVALGISFIRAIFHLQNPSLPYEPELLYAFVALAVTGALILERAFAKKAGGTLTMALVLLFVLLGFVLEIPFFDIPLLQQVLLDAGFFIFETVVLALAADLRGTGETSTVGRSAGLLAVVEAAALAGRGLGWLFVSTIPYDAPHIFQYSLIGVIAIASLFLIGCLLLLWRLQPTWPHHGPAIRSLDFLPFPRSGGHGASLGKILEADCRILASQYGLTEREREVLVMLSQGATMPKISKALHISTNTAKSHIAHVYQKLDVHAKDELFELLLKADLLRTGGNTSDKEGL